jgi:hypothetical protein
MSLSRNDPQFEKATLFNADLSLWEVDKVASMEQMVRFLGWGCLRADWFRLMAHYLFPSIQFASCSTFDSDLSDWNVGNVENMDSMVGKRFFGIAGGQLYLTVNVCFCGTIALSFMIAAAF